MSIVLIGSGSFQWSFAWCVKNFLDILVLHHLREVEAQRENPRPLQIVSGFLVNGNIYYNSLCKQDNKNLSRGSQSV